MSCALPTVPTSLPVHIMAPAAMVIATGSSQVNASSFQSDDSDLSIESQGDEPIELHTLPHKPTSRRRPSGAEILRADDASINFDSANHVYAHQAADDAPNENNGVLMNHQSAGPQKGLLRRRKARRRRPSGEELVRTKDTSINLEWTIDQPQDEPIPPHGRTFLVRQESPASSTSSVTSCSVERRSPDSSRPVRSHSNSSWENIDFPRIASTINALHDDNAALGVTKQTGSASSSIVSVSKYCVEVVVPTVLVFVFLSIIFYAEKHSM